MEDYTGEKGGLAPPLVHHPPEVERGGCEYPVERVTHHVFEEVAPEAVVALCVPESRPLCASAGSSVWPSLGAAHVERAHDHRKAYSL